ncbi:MAG TPA: hypothetical protein ENK28_13290 [Aliiroseovarius sp.]|nr:hypothetical protein [Aliiroseovarius sp.]
MPVFRILSAASLLVAVSAPAFAAEDTYFSCSHPEWGQAFGYDSIIVAQSAIASFASGEGVVCEMLETGVEASKPRACEIAAAAGGKSVAAYSAADGSLEAVSCN